MYERELLTKLRTWRDKSHRKPLVLRGARQVGKTTLVDEFAKEFDAYIRLNLEEEDDAAIFRRYTNVLDVWQYLCLKNHVRQDKSAKVLLFIDEIQEEAKAVAMLRYFFEKLNWVYVIAAGSRLQSLVKQRVSFPVGRVEYMNLRPFSFTEYVNAIHGAEWANMIKTLSVPESLHDDMMRAFNRYALIGGMPEAVSVYAETGDIEALSPIFDSLMQGYSEDIEKYAKNQEQAKILNHIATAAWSETASSITFAKFGDSSYTSTQIHDGMNILERAFLLSLDYPITATKAPAKPNKRRSPKLIMVDSGLTNFYAGIQLDYLQNDDLLDTWRGRAAEQIVAQELRIVLDNVYRDKQYFWVRDKKGTKAEVDFIWQYGSMIIPIEVKAGTNAHLRSLHSFVNISKQPVTAIRIWSGNYFVQEASTPAPENKPYKLINVPFYYIGQLLTILKSEIAISSDYSTQIHDIA